MTFLANTGAVVEGWSELSWNFCQKQLSFNLYSSFTV